MLKPNDLIEGMSMSLESIGVLCKELGMESNSSSSPDGALGSMLYVFTAPFIANVFLVRIHYP